MMQSLRWLMDLATWKLWIDFKMVLMTALKHVYYLGWNRSPAQVGCMRQVLRPGALGRIRGIGWRGRWEGGSGWGLHVKPWLIHINVWQKPLQYCKVISLQLIKINGKKNGPYGSEGDRSHMEWVCRINEKWKHRYGKQLREVLRWRQQITWEEQLERSVRWSWCLFDVLKLEIMACFSAEKSREGVIMKYMREHWRSRVREKVGEEGIQSRRGEINLWWEQECSLNCNKREGRTRVGGFVDLMMRR